MALDGIVGNRTSLQTVPLAGRAMRRSRSELSEEERDLLREKDRSYRLEKKRRRLESQEKDTAAKTSAATASTQKPVLFVPDPPELFPIGGRESHA